MKKFVLHCLPYMIIICVVLLSYMEIKNTKATERHYYDVLGLNDIINSQIISDMKKQNDICIISSVGDEQIIKLNGFDIITDNMSFFKRIEIYDDKYRFT